MTTTYKLTLSYRGTNYRGFQYQTAYPNTVQNELEKVLSSIARHEKFQVIGASRTDTGVHANGQVLKVSLPREVSPEHLTMGMNSKLPEDIRVLSSEFIDESFNVNRDSISKEYHYYFRIDKKENAISSDIVYSFSEALDLELIKKACKSLVGENNFKSFCTEGAKPTSPIRTILNCSLEKTQLLTEHQDIYYLKICGSGFKKYMVRFIMGALWDIGLGQLSIDDFKLSLKTGEQHGVRNKAPAKGLHLNHINY